MTAEGRGGWVTGWTVGNRCTGRGEADCGSRDRTGQPGCTEVCGGRGQGEGGMRVGVGVGQPGFFFFFFRKV